MSEMKRPAHKVNLQESFGRFAEPWSPKIVAELNGQYVKLAKLQGEFVWHHHDDEDEFFYVIEGRWLIDLEDREPVELTPGQGFMVPKGVMHRTRAPVRTVVMMIEGSGVVPTGD